MNRNTKTKVGALAGLALLALLAVPNAAAFQLRDSDSSGTCLDTDQFEVHLATAFDTGFEVQEPAVAINTEAVCRITPGTPPGACSYYENAHKEEVRCTVSKDGTGVCYGYYYKYDKDTGETTESCGLRVGT